MKELYISQEGLEKLKEDLNYLKKVRRKEVSERIKKALEEGDISESGEYSEAKEDQAFVEGKIAEIEEKIKNAVIIKKKKSSQSVDIGCTVTLKSDENVIKYSIVGSSEVDPAQGRISNESPLGKAFIGKKVGEVVEVATPAGTVKYEVLGIK